MTTTIRDDVTNTILVTLDNDMIWTDEFKYNSVLLDENKTADYGIWYNERIKTDEIGRKITLESMNGFGYQKKTTVESLKTLDNAPNTKYLLRIVTGITAFNKTVRFDHSNDDEGGVTFEPAADVAALVPADFWYKGTIKLIVA